MYPRMASGIVNRDGSISSRGYRPLPLRGRKCTKDESKSRDGRELLGILCGLYLSMGDTVANGIL
jgi:hypothetical protein